MRHLTLMLCLLLSACAGTPAVKQHVIGTPMDPAAVHILLQEAVKWSRYPMPDVQPIVDIVPEALWMAQECPFTKVSEECGELGYYIFDEPGEHEVVHIRGYMPPDANRPISSVVVHELTHWLQYRNGWASTGMCSDMAAHEMEAYAVEYVYDLAIGVLRPFWMDELLGNCIRASQQQIFIEVIR